MSVSTDAGEESSPSGSMPSAESAPQLTTSESTATLVPSQLTTAASTASLKDSGSLVLWPTKSDEYELLSIIGIGATATVHKVGSCDFLYKELISNSLLCFCTRLQNIIFSNAM